MLNHSTPDVMALRLALQAGGYAPIPVHGKKPQIAKWQTKLNVSHDEIASWGQWRGTGVLAGPTPGLDGDIRDPKAADAVEELVREWFDGRGEILVRFGEAPKRLFPFRTESPFRKIRVEFKAPDGSDHAIELLGDGQQFVVAGTHPDTKQPYSWRADRTPWTVPRSDLPEINEAEARELINLIAEMLHERFGFERIQTNGQSAESPLVDLAGTFDISAKTPVDVAAQLANIHFGNIHNTWKDCMGSLLRDRMPANDIIRLLLRTTEQSAACQADPNRGKWAQNLSHLATWFISHDYEFILSLAAKQQTNWHTVLQEGKTPQLIWRNDHGLQVRREINNSEPIAGEPSDASSAEEVKTNEKPEEKENAEDSGKPHPWPTPYSKRAASQIPLRRFVLGQHYLTGATSVTASAGGVGKSTLSLLDAVSLIVGRNLLTGEVLDKQRRVWVWNAEDDVDEMERRIVGICAHYNIDRADLDGWLFLDSGYDLPLELAHGNGKGTAVQEGLIDLIATRVKERNIEVVMLDPLVALHSMAENDSSGHSKLIRTLSTKVAKPCACALDINAHTRKPGPGQDTMTADDIRGTGAIVYSARSGRILHPMSLVEAEKYNIEADDRLSYYRLERAKANMAKRGTICWVHMVETPIANRPDGSYGDTVAVPVIWTPPDAMEGITETVANAIGGEIAKGEYKRDARAGASWAGRLVGLRCGIDIGTKSGKDRAKVILETLIRKGVLAVEIRTDKNRNAREYVVPGVFRAPK